MEVIVGNNSGFCYGVKRAVEGAKYETMNQKVVYCLGEIVHNQFVINDLKKQGVIFIEKIEDAKGKTIIRAHGVSKEVYEKAKNMSIELKDLTCPSVLKIHEIAKNYSKKGYYIIITGKENHPEVIGIQSYCGNKYGIIKDKEEIQNLLEIIKNESNILLISQTTYSSEKFDEIANLLKQKLGSKIEIKKTICPATEMRQKETAEIAKNVDLMIIIGDKKSSNTQKLYDISCEFCNNVIFVDDNTKLDLEVFKNINKVGIMAGASTPNEQIEKVKGCLK